MFLARRQYTWIRAPHHKIICDALTRVYEGHCARLIINIPPRYSKTELAVVNFIAWAFGNVPDAEFIHASYGATLATNNSSAVRGMLQHDAYAEIFPGCQLASEAKAHWTTTAGGVMYSAGAGGTITGFGAGKQRAGFGGCIIVDDPHKADEARSDLMRKNVIDWFQNTLESRKNSRQTPIILIMQRLHESDLSGWLLAGKNGEKWEHICIPVIQGDDTALWPVKHDIDTLRKMEKAAPYVFAGQYMQRPAPVGGGIFKSEWWKWYRLDATPKFKRIIQSWDTAFKTKEVNDYSVCTTWGEADSGYYLIDILKGKFEFPELKKIAISHAAKYKPHAILVEDKASGQSLVQELRRDSMLFIVPVKKESDKISCANAVTPMIEAGRVFLPEGHPEVGLFVSSCSQFPNAAHDDDVDSATQALNYLSRGGGKMGLFEFMRQKSEDLKPKEPHG